MKNLRTEVLQIFLLIPFCVCTEILFS